MSNSIKLLTKANEGLSKPSGLSICSGAGGMDRGFVEAGFEVAAAVEKWDAACKTHRKNFPDAKLFDGDITDPKLKAKVVEFLKGLVIDVVFGGVPCTGFSLLGKRNPKAACNYLYRDYLELVDKTRPKVFCIENVGGLLSMSMKDGSLAIEAIAAAAVAIGYKVEFRVLCAADHGVAQLRKRVIIIGTRYDIPILFPEPTHGPEGSGLAPYVTVREAIGDLQERAEDDAFSHVFTRHSPKLMKRIKATKPGQALYARNHGCRLDPDKPAATLTNNNGSTVIHYALDRMITPRECARIQGFSDGHIFCGSKNDVGKQVGNALPPSMAKAVAESILKMLDAIEAGAPELNASALLAPVVVSMAPDGESLKAEVAGLRKSYVGKINTEQEKIDAATGRVDSVFLRIGRLIAQFIDEAKAKGETREDYLFKSIAKDPACKVRKGALYNARSYYVAHSEMTEKYGKAPDVPMTDYVKVRHDALTIDERRDLLLKAEQDPTITASKLNAMVADKLKEKGLGRKEPAPDAELAAQCNKAFSALTKAAGLLVKGIVPSGESVSLLGKTANMAANCMKKAGLDWASIPWGTGDAIPERKAS